MHPILAGLDADQQAVATALRGPVVVYAGAGAGKTRAITHRIAYAAATGAHDPARTLAVTFTAKAAGEMRARLGQLGVREATASTFHAAALRQLRHFWSAAIGGEPWEIAPSKARLIAEAASRVGVATDTAVVRDLSAEIEWAKVREIGLEGFAASVGQREMPASLTAREVAEVWRAYEDVKRQRAVIDFEDVLLLTAGVLTERDDIAAEVRRRYGWFTVDEYQDLNPLQHRLLRLWLGERDELCVVGDPAQTIYTFAGADPSYLRDFDREWPQATVVTLPRTYRCTPEIARVANRVLAAAHERRVLQLQSQRPAGAAPVVRDFDDEVAEAEGVATEIAGWIAAGTAVRDIAVLYRTNAQSEAFEQALSERGIAYTVRGSERFFDRAEVRRAVALIRTGAGAAAAEDLVGAVRGIVSSLGWRESSPPTGGSSAREVWEAYLALVTLAQDLAAAQPDATLGDLVIDLDRRAAQQHAPAVDGVTLASLHAAKGLEWSHVVVAGCVEGTLPIFYAEDETAIAEERRLFYVGITRAADVLVCTWARSRAVGSRTARQRSRFLDAAFGADRQRPASERATVRRGEAKAPARRNGPAKCRVCGAALVTGRERTLGHCDTCPTNRDEALYERLVAWRKEEAAERSVPAYVVFTDATLAAIAERRPTSRRELAVINGIGAKKLEAYCDVLLGLVGD